ncbi:protein kinase family protein [Nonomuraea glycinis]|uniref:hypothetical protein n=1 Tax=Nonomuraea glycinis TaxID=2047744 RepID=UPI002E13D1A4|nr:hypothetical protein OHA68_02815 [Nonomuraea glycinis]
MTNPRNGIAGFQLTEHTWITEVGNWIDAISPDGRRAGALLFDARIIDAPGVRDRVVAAVLTDRRLAMGGLPGLIPVADVVAAGSQVWLLTAQAVTPTLAGLLAAGSVDASGAASVLAETAHTLVALHAAGITHGSVQPGTVVITAEGGALLSERGLSDAIHGRLSTPERDSSGWAALARGLAASCARGAPRAADLFERAAATATTRGLTAARSMLLAERDLLPGGVISRHGLAQAARGQSVFAQPLAYTRPEDAAGSGREADRDEGDIVTLLRVPGTSTGPGTGTGPDGPYPGAGFGAGAGLHPGAGAGFGAGAGAGFGAAGQGSAGDQAMLGSQAPTHPSPGNQDAERFGPGVGTETPVERIWREGRDGPRRGSARRSKAERARRRRTILAAGVLAVILAGAAVAWFRLGASPDLTVASVAVKAPKKAQRCNSSVLITGTIVTNGEAGEITYEWRKNLDKEVVKATLETTSDKTSYSVPLRWSLKGKSTVKATATLRVLSPGPPRTGKASFTYRC